MASRPFAIDEQEYPAEFISFLQSEASAAVDDRLNDQRAAALRAYNGEPYGDEIEGQSQAVTRDVSEVIDFMQTGILGTVVASGKAVEFETEPEATEAGKVDYGAQATAAVRYIFFRKQRGYRILHDALKAGQLEKTGVVKTFAEMRAPVRQTHIVPRAAIDDDGQGNPSLGGMQVVDATPLPEEQQPALGVGFHPLSGEPVPLGRHPGDVLHEVSVMVPQPPVVRDQTVPNEWMLISGDTVDLDEAPYIGECTPKSISQLVAMGYDYAMLKELWDNAPADTVVENTRDGDRSRSRNNVGRREGAQRQLWFYEEYPLFDLNGDGISERLFVHRIGNHILKVMPVDEQPYSGWSPIPMQHRFVGQSMADKTQDIQRIRTALLRQGLNGIYLSNVPRMMVDINGETEDTIDDLLTVRPGGIIRYKGGIAPVPVPVSDVSSGAFAAMEMMSAERESRTGVTRQSQGLNPDTMNKTASGMAMLQTNSDQFELYVCRNFVEQLVAPMFEKRYRLMKAFVPPFRMKIDGKFVEVDPAKWPDEIDININVGLGSGTKDERIGALTQIISTQAEARQQGVDWVTDQNQFEAVSAWIEASGMGSPSRFVTDPASLPPKQEQPKIDPDVVKAQADGQAKQQQLAQDHQQTMARLSMQQQAQEAETALRSQQNEFDLQAKRESAALDSQLKRDKAAEEAHLAEQRFLFEQGLAIRRQEFDEQQARRDRTQEGQDSGITALRPGGDLDQ